MWKDQPILSDTLCDCTMVCFEPKLMMTKAHQFAKTIDQFQLGLNRLAEQAELSTLLEQMITFCDQGTHSFAEDLDEDLKSRKDYFTQSIGWVIPSLEMLTAIQKTQATFGAPICDYGSGTGLLINLLGLLRS